MTSLGTSIRLSAGYCISCTLERYDAASLRNYLSQESNQKRPANKAVSKRARSQKLAPVIKSCLSSSLCSRHLTPAKKVPLLLSSWSLSTLTSATAVQTASLPPFPIHLPSHPPPPLTKHFDPSSDPAQTRRELYSQSAATDVRRQSSKTAPNPSCDPQ